MFEDDEEGFGCVSDAAPCRAPRGDNWQDRHTTPPGRGGLVCGMLGVRAVREARRNSR